MKKTITDMIFGRGNLVSGLIALTIIGLLVLGCTCGKDDDSTTTSNSSTDSPLSSKSGDKDSPLSSKSDDDDSTSGGIISKNDAESLLKATASDFADAIDTEDFTTFYNNASQDFQHTYTVDQVKDGFKTYIDKKSMILSSLKAMQTTDPDLTTPPHTRTEAGQDILVLEGEYPTKPHKVGFDAEYIKRGGEWKMLIWKLMIK